MFEQIFIPTQQHHSVELPDEFYGKEVKVIAFPVNHQQLAAIKAADEFYDKAQIDFTGFRFDRDEANER